MVAANSSDAEAVALLVRNLHALNLTLKVPTPAEFGIDHRAWEESIPSMVQQALASGSPANNPRLPSEVEMKGLYREIWK